MSLEIYARCEHLIGIEESTQVLHSIFLEALLPVKPATLLDVGCGRGLLMQRLHEHGIEADGVDLSETMIAEARLKGLNAQCKDICEVTKQYDAAVAVFDVLNFVSSDELEGFLECIARVLKPGGLFFADVNTLHGFRNVAEGTMSAEDETMFLSVDAVFDGEQLQTQFTLFEKASAECYTKAQDTITQYFHPLKRFRNFKAMKLKEHYALSLYDDNDKTMLIFQKPKDTDA